MAKSTAISFFFSMANILREKKILKEAMAKMKGLGRGLDALLGSVETPKAGGEILIAGGAVTLIVGAIMLSLDHGVPRELNLKEMLHYFVEHRHTVVVRRAEFELRDYPVAVPLTREEVLDSSPESLRELLLDRAVELATFGLAIDSFGPGAVGWLRAGPSGRQAFGSR